MSLFYLCNKVRNKIINVNNGIISKLWSNYEFELDNWNLIEIIKRIKLDHGWKPESIGKKFNNLQNPIVEINEEWIVKVYVL